MSDDPVLPSPEGEPEPERAPAAAAANAGPTVSSESSALETAAPPAPAPASLGAPSESAPASPPPAETVPPPAAVFADPLAVESASASGAPRAAAVPEATPALGPGARFAPALALDRDFEADSEGSAGRTPSPAPVSSQDPASAASSKGESEGEGEPPARSVPNAEGDRPAPREESWRGGPSDGPPGSAKPRREERDRPRAPRGPRPDLTASEEPLYRESRGYRMRLEPPDLARLRELPGSKGKTDRELGEIFFDGLSERFTTSLAEDVPSPAEVRVVVDPYSRQAFLAVERKIRSILSF